MPLVLNTSPSTWVNNRMFLPVFFSKLVCCKTERDKSLGLSTTFQMHKERVPFFRKLAHIYLHVHERLLYFYTKTIKKTSKHACTHNARYRRDRTVLHIQTCWVTLAQAGTRKPPPSIERKNESKQFEPSASPVACIIEIRQAPVSFFHGAC